MSNHLQSNGVETGSEAAAHLKLSDTRDGQGESQPSFTASSPKSKGAPRMGRAPKLRLLARLHGEGLVIWPGSPVAVTYDLDVFGGGSSRTASGFLDGDFTVAYGSDQDEVTGPTSMAARLRLGDGHEVPIQMVVVASDLAEFEAPLTSAEADLLSSRR